MVVDGHFKTQFAEDVAARKAATELLARYPMLQVEIYDKLGRANLMLHAKGGTRRAKGANIAIPSSVNVRRTGRGAVTRSQTPKGLADKGVRMFVTVYDDSLPRSLDKPDRACRNMGKVFHKMSCKRQTETLQIRQGVAPGQGVHSILHRVGGDDGAIVAVRVGGVKITLQLDGEA